MPVLITNYDEIRLGIVSEDCAFHPCLCTKVDPEADEVQGISLIDGSAPRCCSVKHCGLKALTMDEAMGRVIQRIQVRFRSQNGGGE